MAHLRFERTLIFAPCRRFVRLLIASGPSDKGVSPSHGRNQWSHTRDATNVQLITCNTGSPIGRRRFERERKSYRATWAGTSPVRQIARLEQTVVSHEISESSPRRPRPPETSSVSRRFFQIFAQKYFFGGRTRLSTPGIGTAIWKSWPCYRLLRVADANNFAFQTMGMLQVRDPAVVADRVRPQSRRDQALRSGGICLRFPILRSNLVIWIDASSNQSAVLGRGNKKATTPHKLFGSLPPKTTL